MTHHPVGAKLETCDSKGKFICTSPSRDFGAGEAVQQDRSEYQYSTTHAVGQAIMTSTAAQTPASVARKRPIPHHAAPSSSYNNGQLPSPSPSPQSIPACFGPRAPDMIVTPRRGEPDSGVKVRKPHTGMTIRLTPELLARLQKPGPKPSMELILKSAAEGRLVNSFGTTGLEAMRGEIVAP